MKNKYKIILTTIILISLPSKVNADLCKKEPLNYRYEWCLRGDENTCYSTTDDIPSDLSSFYLKYTKLPCKSGYTEKNGMCVQTSGCTDELDNTTQNINIKLENTPGVCQASAVNNSEIVVQQSKRVNRGCYGTSTYTCKATIKIESNYDFRFKDYETTPIKSLVDSSKTNQYAPGTGTTFDVLYNSNLKYQVIYNQEKISYSIGETDCWTSTSCTPNPCPPKPPSGGGGGGGIPKTCSNTLENSDTNPAASFMGCGETCTSTTHCSCDYSRSATIDCTKELQVSVEAVLAGSSNVKVNYVNANTPTTKGEESQYLGILKDSGTQTNNNTKTALQRYTFTNPNAFINIKTGDILYQGINYNGQNTNIWKNITPGYYIPINAIPEQRSTVTSEIGGVAYIIKVNGVENKRINIDGKLSCNFSPKLAGCPYVDCGDANCDPEKDAYKCCRNTKYLKEHPNHYANVCSGEENYIYRQISLLDPFPNREAGENWNSWINEDKNKENLANSFSKEPEYSIELTNSMIQRIREYNDHASNVYTSWTEMNDDGSSKFLTSYGFETLSSYYSLGCGPSNSKNYEWCK